MSQDPAAAKAQFEQIVLALSHQKIVSYFDVLSTAILCYDVIANFDIELKHIWMRKWSIVTAIYIVQRYLPFFDVASLTLHHQFGNGLSTEYCSLNYHIVAWSISFGLLLSEILLTLRVWAVWKRSIRVGIGLVIFLLGCWVYDFVVVARFLSSIEFATLPFPNFHGCFISGGSNILYMNWVFLMVYDTGILTMILIPGFKAYQSGRISELVRTVYQDGAIYYGLVFLVSMTNVIVIRTLPPDLLPILSSFERVLHSILTSHVVLHIRQIAARDFQQSYPMLSPDESQDTAVPSLPSQNRVQTRSIWDVD